MKACWEEREVAVVLEEEASPQRRTEGCVLEGLITEGVRGSMGVNIVMVGERRVKGEERTTGYVECFGA